MRSEKSSFDGIYMNHLYHQRGVVLYKIARHSRDQVRLEPLGEDACLYDDRVRAHEAGVSV